MCLLSTIGTHAYAPTNAVQYHSMNISETYRRTCLNFPFSCSCFLFCFFAGITDLFSYKISVKLPSLFALCQISWSRKCFSVFCFCLFPCLFSCFFPGFCFQEMKKTKKKHSSIITPLSFQSVGTLPCVDDPATRPAGSVGWLP